MKYEEVRLVDPPRQEGILLVPSVPQPAEGLKHRAGLLQQVGKNHHQAFVPHQRGNLNDALADIQDAQRHGNPHIRLLGVILSGVDKRTRLASTLNEYVEQIFAPDGRRSAKFKTTISRSTVIPQAQKLGKTLFQTQPTHAVTEQYRALAREVETRLLGLTGHHTNLGLYDAQVVR